MNFFSRCLHCIGAFVPPWLPHGSAIGNRILKPLYKYLIGSRWENVMIWEGVRMQVNPCECIGGNLFFCPQLYDRDERDWIAENLDPNGIFIDVGANIGAYTLWAAKKLSNVGRIIAIEADPDTFKVLQENLLLNSLKCTVQFENVGVSDIAESITFYRNTRGNTGANSFLQTGDGVPTFVLRAEPLYEVIKRNDLTHIDFMKIDIEGFELKVLTRFFSDCSNYDDLLLPRFVLIELDEGPRRDDVEYRNNILQLFAKTGYEVRQNGKNTLFHLDREMI
jgi:FkbM family methyltransferase